jgi:predicted component of type VI protein secretion system
MILPSEKILLTYIPAQFLSQDFFPMLGPDGALPGVPNAALQRPESTPAFYSIFCLFRSRTPTYVWARTRTRYAMRFRCTP